MLPYRYGGILKIHITTKIHSGIRREPVHRPAPPGLSFKVMTSPLMNQMVAMVMEKKVSGSIWTRTRAAVREKSSRMAPMLTATRTRSRTLTTRAKQGVSGGPVWGSGGLSGGLTGFNTMEGDTNNAVLASVRRRGGMHSAGCSGGSAHHWYRKELSRVKSRRGSMDRKVIQLLKL